jgi:hypothetical protein
MMTRVSPVIHGTFTVPADLTAPPPPSANQLTGFAG